MISTHVYNAFLIGSPDVELSLRGGSITLDDTAAPHVQGGIEIAWPGHWEIVPDNLPVAYGGLVWVRDDDVLAALDPRLTPRVRVEVDGQYPAFSVHREFDLGVRTRVPDQVSRVVQLGLASDEALLDDYAPLADDDTPFDLAASLRDVVDYVLGEAVPGASLAVSPANDADMTPYWSVTNLLLNPSAESSITNWSAAGNCTIFHAAIGRTGPGSCGFTSAAAGDLAVSPMSLSGKTGVTSGRSYVLDGYGQRGLSSAVPAGTTIRAVIRWVDANGATPWADVLGNAVVMGTGAWSTRTIALGEAPAGAVAMFPFFRVTGATAAGQIGYIEDAMVHEGTRSIPFFHPTHAVTPGYTVAWSNVANASTSTRTPIVARDPESLTWRAGDTGIEFLQPLVQAAGFRLVCDETRTWTLRDESYLAPGSLNIKYGVNLIEGSDAIRRDDGVWFDARVTRYRWTDRDGIQREAVDAFTLIDPPTRVDRIEVNAPYPGPGRSEYAVRRAQGRGREVDASAVARWTEHAEQSITVELDGAEIQYGKTSRVTFTLGPGDARDRVVVTTRTTDIDPDAWLLGDDTQDWMTGDLTETWL